MKSSQNKEQVVVLTIDDEEENNELVRRTFKPLDDYEVLSAESAQQAIGIISQRKVDVILVDHKMPDRTGSEFLVEARAVAPQAICIIITGYPEMKEVIRSLDKKLVSRIISNPYQPEDLKTIVQQLLSKKAISA